MTSATATSRRSTSSITDLALIAVFAGFIAALTLIPGIPVGPLGVPITLQTLAIALTALVLGPVRGLLATLLYLAVGLAGAPIFANGGAGIGKLFGPTGGFLVGFALGAFVIGFLGYRFLAARGPRWYLFLIATLIGTFVFIHIPGIIGMGMVGVKGLKIASGDLLAAAVWDLAYVPGDLIKAVVAALIAVPVHRAFPWLSRR